MRLAGWLIALCLALVPLAPAEAQSTAAFSLSPAAREASDAATGSYFVLAVPAGQSRSETVLVSNGAPDPVVLDLYPVDGLTGAGTGAAYAAKDVQPTGAGGWLRLPVGRVEVPARATARVSFEIAVPSAARPGQHLAGLVAQSAAAPGRAESAVGAARGQLTLTTTTRVIVAVAITVPGPLERRLTVTGVRTVDGPTGTQLAVAVRNDGNVLLKPRGRLALRDDAGAPRADLPLVMDTILPGGAADFVVPWPRELPAGSYSAEVALDGEDALPAAGQGAQAAPGPAASAAHAELRSPPMAVRPVASGPTSTLATPDVDGRPVEAPGAPVRPWLALGAVALVALLGATAAIVLPALRSTRSAPSPPPARPEKPPGPAFVKGRAATIYRLEGGVRRPFASWESFVADGGSPTLANVRLLPEDALAAIPEGAPIENEARSA